MNATERKVLKAGRSFVHRRFAAEQALQQQASRFDVARRKLAGKSLNKLFDQAWKLLGADGKAMAEKQVRANEAVQRFAKEHAKKDLALWSNLRTRDHRYLKGKAERLAHLLNQGVTQVPPAPYYEYLPTATAIDIDSIPASTPSVGTVSTAPNQNVAETGVIAASMGNEANSRRINWHFLWTPPRVGLLNVISFATLKGYLWREVHPVCSGTVAGNSITASLGVFQSGAGDRIVAPYYQGEIESGFASKWHDEVFDDNIALIYDQQFVVKAAPMLITVSVDLGVWVDGGMAEIIAWGDGKQLGVPFLLLALA